MTTNSPNPVDGDVQALITDCQAEIVELEKRLTTWGEAWIPYLQSKLKRQQVALAALTAKPVGWTDAQELRDVEKAGCGYLFTANPVTPNADERRVILLYTAQPAQLLRPVKLPDEQSRHQLPKLPDPVTAQDMKELLNIPMFQEEAECAASAFNQCLMECQPVYDAAKRIKGALDECMKEMDSMQESINYKYKTLIKWRNRAIELEEEVQRLNATAQPVSDGLIRVPDEFLHAIQNEKGLFELSEDCMCRLATALSQQSKGLVMPPDSLVVPKILTREMRHAWDGAPNANTDDDDLNMQRAYSAMLAAAPGGQDD